MLRLRLLTKCVYNIPFIKKGEECDALLVVLIDTLGHWLCSLTCPNFCLLCSALNC